MPVLLGDSVVITKEPGASSIAVPTTENLPPLRDPIAGFCKKVHILDNRLTIAWTGSRLRARQILTDLKAYIRKVGVSDTALEGFLKHYKFSIDHGGELILLGWVAEGEPRPFWWSSLSKTFCFDECEIEGQGSEIFGGVKTEASMSAEGGGLNAIENAYVKSLAQIAKLLTLETRSGLPLQNGFGFCYDIVAWCGYRFKNIPSYTQVNIDFTYDSKAGGGHFAFSQPILKYKSLGQRSAFSALRWSEEQNADLSLSISGSEPTVIPPVWPFDEKIEIEKMRFHSKYMCAFLTVSDEVGRSFAGPYCITDQATRGDGMWLSKNGSKEVLEFDTGIIARMHTAAFGPN